MQTSAFEHSASRDLEPDVAQLAAQREELLAGLLRFRELALDQETHPEAVQCQAKLSILAQAPGQLGGLRISQLDFRRGISFPDLQWLAERNPERELSAVFLDGRGEAIEEVQASARQRHGFAIGEHRRGILRGLLIVGGGVREIARGFE